MAQTGEAKPEMLDTGVPNLDLVLGGGLRRHNSYLIMGPPGVGKSVLNQQIAFHRAKRGDRVLFITGLDEPHQNLIEHMRTFRFADIALIGPQIETVSVVPFLALPVDEKIDVLRQTVLNARPQFVTLDGLRSFEAFVGGRQGLYHFLYGLTSWFAVEGITLLLTRDTDSPAVQDNPETSLVDGVLLLRRDLVDGHSRRRLWVCKMRGQKPLDGLHPFTIDADGVAVWPRPQATFRLEERPWSQARLAFGIPSLDPMLGGGLPEMTSTLLAGDPGAGKTVLALAFLNDGVRQGQRGLWVGFRETRARLPIAGKQWSSDLAEAEAQGQVAFLTLAPFELEPGLVAARLRDQVAELGARRLVLDAAEVLEQAFPSQPDAEHFLRWLVEALPQQGVTTLVTRRVPRIPWQEFAVPGLPFISLVDNVILVRQLQRRGQLRRAVAVIKMSSPGYDMATREFTLDQHGVTVGEPVSTEIEVVQPALRASNEPVRGPI